MAATGKTPILLYGSTTATNTPSAGNLTNSSDGCEIAINVADKNLFFKDSTNAVNTVPIRQSSTSSNGWLSSTDWNTFNNKQPAGTYVTSVTGTAPVVSSGGTTPAISMAAATGSVNGYLTSTDWTTFNSKQAALVSGTNIKTVNGTTLLGSGDLGTITVAYGGTGLTAVTAGYIPFGSSATALSTDASLFWDNTNKILKLYKGTGTSQFRVGASDSYYWDVSRDNDTTGDLVVKNYNASGSPTARLTLKTGGDVTVNTGNLVIGTSGKGIDFSATAGTGTSELLADYEEGSWTPTQGVGLTVVGTFSSSGTYTKVGRLVTVTANLNATTSIVASSGGIACGGLPYTVSGAHVGSLSSNALNQSGSVSAYGTNVYSGSATTSATGLILTVTYMV